MTTQHDLRGLPSYEWRLADTAGGETVPQQRVKVRLDVDYTARENQDPLKLADKLLEFGRNHADAEVEVEHKYEDNQMYPCEVWLELTGWATRSDADVRRARERARAQLRTEELEHERFLKQRREAEEARLARRRAELAD